MAALRDRVTMQLDAEVDRAYPQRWIGKVSVATRIQSGRLSGARFWKNGSFSAPSTNRLSAIGRPRTPTSAPSATVPAR